MFMPKKLTYEQVKNYIEENGYVLLSTEYVNSVDKLILMCPNGHQYKASYGKFQNGRRCPVCSNCVKIEKEDVNALLNSSNYTLISDFQNSNVPIVIECPYGHEWRVTFQKFKLGRRCPKCIGDQRTGKGHVTWDTEMVREYLSKEKYVLISDVYNNAQEKITVKCDNNHQIEIYWTHFLKGVRCRHCNFEKQSSEQRRKIEDVDKILLDIGYKRESPYINGHKNMKLTCDKGHITKMSLNNLIAGVRCKFCKKKSKGEEMVNSYLKSININFNREVRKSVVENNRVRYMSFDFGILNSKKEYVGYIEFDGIQHFKNVSFFREDLNVIKERDVRKNNYCKNKNIPLLRIPYTSLKECELLINDFLNDKLNTKLFE